MKRFLPFALTLALALVALAGCSSNSTATEDDAAATDAVETEAVATDTIEIDPAAKTVTITAVSTGNMDESIHFLANADGSNAEKARFNTTITTRELFNALEEIGAVHGDNIKVDDNDGTIEGSDLKMEIVIDGTSYTPEQLVTTEEDRTAAPRFGGNVDLNEEYATGCMYCTESCSLGITSDSAYQYKEKATFLPTDKMPAAGTQVTIIYTLLDEDEDARI